MTDTPEVNDIPAILARADAATKGPWANGGESDELGGWSVYATDISIGEIEDEADAEFCAHSRTDVPNMAAEILSLRARLEEARAMRNDLIRRLGERAYPELSRREKENG